MTIMNFIFLEGDKYTFSCNTVQMPAAWENDSCSRYGNFLERTFIVDSGMARNVICYTWQVECDASWHHIYKKSSWLEIVKLIKK
jgi:hypothetical protein